MESTQKLDIVRLIDLKKEELGSYNLVAKKLNISAGTISNMRFNKWDLISSDKWIEVAKQLGATTSTIWQISPQTRDYKHLMLLLDRVRESCSFQIICERAGGCKTTGLKAYANQHQNNSSTPVYYMSAREWGSKRFMQELATTIGCRWFHKDTADAILTKVINHIELEVNQKPMFILDECDKLKPGGIRNLIYLFNAFEDRISVVISGAEALRKNMARGVAYSALGYDELESRFGRSYMPMIGNNKKDVTAVCTANSVYDPEVVQEIWENVPKIKVTRPSGKSETVVKDMRRLKKMIQIEIFKTLQNA